MKRGEKNTLDYLPQRLDLRRRAFCVCDQIAGGIWTIQGEAVEDQKGKSIASGCRL